jgi:hypothetical protein
MGGQLDHIERWIDDSGRQQVRGVQRHVLRRGSRGGHTRIAPSGCCLVSTTWIGIAGFALVRDRPPLIVTLESEI